MGQKADIHSDYILCLIKSKREKMMECANQKGFTNDETIKFSQELDELIYFYQTRDQNSISKQPVFKSFIANLSMNLPKALTAMIQVIFMTVA